jgi:4'-phosphopantetheinyl transferase
VTREIAWRSSALDLPHGACVVVVACPFDFELVDPTPTDLSEAAAKPELESAFLARRSATRQILAERLGTPAKEVIVAHVSSGAPLILSPETELRLSVSGRGDFCAIAIARTPVGVDIEPLRERFEPPWNILHPDERSSLLGLEESQRHAAFLRIWTAKEAYLKALGKGLAEDPALIAIRAAPQESFSIEDRGDKVKTTAAQWRRLELGKHDFIAACVCL